MTPTRFHPVAEGVLWSSPDPQLDRPLLGLVWGRDATLAVDAGASPAHASWLLEEISARGLPPLRYVVYTHAHWDHIFGASELVERAGAEVVAHRMTAERVKALAALAWDDASLQERVERGEEHAFCAEYLRKELPDRTHLRLVLPHRIFDGPTALDLGGVTVELEHVGGDHAPESTLVYVVEREVLFAGDALYPTLGASTRLTHDILQRLLERVFEKPAQHLLLSHDDRVMSRAEAEGLAAFSQLVGTLAADPSNDVATAVVRAREALGEDLPADDVAQLFATFRGMGPPSSTTA